MDNNDIINRLNALEVEVADLRAREQILDVLTNYARALDWLDRDILEGVFFDDADIDYGFFQGKGAEFKPLLMQVEESTGRRWHFTSQVKIHLIDAKHAEVESYNLTVAAANAEPQQPDPLTHFYGFYLDRFEKRDGRWGIVSRKHLLHAGTSVQEIKIEGDLEALNTIGHASTAHSDYRKL